MIKWHIGCSGFHYKHWRGTFYPDGLAQKKWFEYYCQHFNTIELNVTFYRFPKISFLANWYAQSPHDFQFAVKAPRAITHYKQFNGTVDMLSDFYLTTREGLQEKLGCILFQLPPNFHYQPDRLEKIIKSLDNSFLNVLEFRHISWWKKEVYDELSKLHISFCGMSHPSLPDDLITNSTFLYYRLHGAIQLYASSYNEDFLKQLVSQIQSNPKTEKAFIFFNNDINTNAVFNATKLQKLTST